MRRLYLLRHAKSSWGDASTKDFDRPLNQRGERAAAAMAVYCRQIGLAPGRVICSPAWRTRETWARIAAEMDAPPEADFDRSIYEASSSALATAIAETPAKIQDVLLIGHNPGIHQVAIALAAAPIADFSTGALAILETDSDDWSALTPNSARMADFVTPKSLV